MKLPSKVFVDTSFFIALLNSRDVDHNLAVSLQEESTRQATHKVTSEYVVLELCDGLAKLYFRDLVVQLVGLIRLDRSFQIISASSDVLLEAWDLFKSREDKEWGLTDCTSFVIMRRFELDTALTADRHFQQAGFYAVLLDED